MPVVVEMDIDALMKGLSEELDGIEMRLNSLNAVTKPVLKEMEDQNKKRMKFNLHNPKSLSGFIAPSSWYIGSSAPRYAKGLWINNPEWVFDIVLKYILTGKVG